jgi:hypothetical protein
MGVVNMTDAENKFEMFILETQERNAYIYRDQLKRNSSEGRHYLQINMEHLLNHDEPLA